MRSKSWSRYICMYNFPYIFPTLGWYFFTKMMKNVWKIMFTNVLRPRFGSIYSYSDCTEYSIYYYICTYRSVLLDHLRVVYPTVQVDYSTHDCSCTYSYSTPCTISVLSLNLNTCTVDDSRYRTGGCRFLQGSHWIAARQKILLSCQGSQCCR